jgi:alpha-tubulin suppressor-like RCC1 family protein
MDDQGQLGLSENKEPIHDQTIPNLVERDFGKISMVACGSKHTAVVADGELFMAGWNQYRQCGIADTENVKSFRFVSLPLLGKAQKVVDVACGDWHTVVVVEYC